MLHESVDLSKRADPSTLPEWMDEPCTYEEFRACLVDLAHVNQISMGHRPTLSWLDQLARTPGLAEPLHIVDVGCGGGDMLVRIAAWARKRGIAVRLTGVDLNPYAVRAARELARSHAEIEWIAGDVYALAPSAPIDVVLSSLVTHHLTGPEIVRFVAWMEAVAERGWFINDLQRGHVNFYGFQLLAKICGWHRFVQHDGPVSFRRSFVKADWKRTCVEAGVPLAEVRITSQLPGRLCVGRTK